MNAVMSIPNEMFPWQNWFSGKWTGNYRDWSNPLYSFV
jgi:hypothetical protein